MQISFCDEKYDDSLKPLAEKIENHIDPGIFTVTMV